MYFIEDKEFNGLESIKVSTPMEDAIKDGIQNVGEQSDKESSEDNDIVDDCGDSAKVNAQKSAYPYYIMYTQTHTYMYKIILLYVVTTKEMIFGHIIHKVNFTFIKLLVSFNPSLNKKHECWIESFFIFLCKLQLLIRM